MVPPGSTNLRDAHRRRETDGGAMAGATRPYDSGDRRHVLSPHLHSAALRLQAASITLTLMANLKFGALYARPRPDRAAEIEAMGYHSIWVSEHILFHVPMLEALTQLAAISAVTTRITLGAAIYLMPLRHPTITAKTAGTLSVISEGRLVLGVGVGGEYPAEFAASGVPVKQRGTRTDEAIDICRRLWREEGVSYQGRHFQIADVSMRPLPTVPPPIWVAGRSDAAIRRAGERGDGYMPYLFHPQRYRDSLAKVRATAEAAGRDPAAITPALYQFICLADSFEEARKVATADLGVRYNQSFEGLAERYCVLGNADQCRARLLEFADAGAEHFVLVPLGPTDAFVQLEAISRELLPVL